MRGARRSHNTIARTADRHPQSAPAVIRTAPRDRPTGCTARGSARPAPTTQSRSINDGADRSLADAPGAHEDRGLVLHRRRRLTKGPRREARSPERAPRLLLSMRGRPGWSAGPRRPSSLEAVARIRWVQTAIAGD